MPSPKKTKKSQPEYVLHYWSAKGRAEVIRLTLALCGLEWSEQPVVDETTGDMKKKAGTAEMPFGQWPLLVEDGETLCQTQAIVKHLGRQHGLYGRNKKEDYLVDSFLLGADAMRSKISDMRWVHGNTPEARAKIEKENLNPESKTGTCGGAHMAYFEGFLERSPSEYVAGGKKLTVADIFLFDLYQDCADVAGAEKLAQWYPKCAAHQKLISEIEPIAAYLKSDKRFAE